MKFKRFSVLFILLSYISLILPIYRTIIDGEEGCELIIKGYNLVEFSVWGNLIFAIPIIILAITYSRQDGKIKNLLLVAMHLFSIVVFYNASKSADIWIRGVADGFVLCRPYQMISFIFVFASMVCSFMYINRDADNVREEDGEESICCE